MLTTQSHRILEHWFLFDMIKQTNSDNTIKHNTQSEDVKELAKQIYDKYFDEPYQF